MDTNNQQERTLALGYIAAMVQGEGSISLDVLPRRGKYQLQPSVRIYNTDPEVVELVMTQLAILGIGSFCMWHTHTNPKHKAIAHIKIAGFKRVGALLNQIGDFLVGEKGRKALFLRQWHRRRTEVPHNTPYSDDEIKAVIATFGTTSKVLLRDFTSRQTS